MDLSELADRNRKLAALYDVMQVAAEPIDRQTMLAKSLERVMAAVAASAGAIFLLDESGLTLKMAAHQGLSAELVFGLEHLSLQTGLIGWVASERAPVAVPDVYTDPRTTLLVRQAHLRAFVGVPMIARHKLLGVVGVFRTERLAFSDEDIALLDSVADQIGVAVENHRLRLQAEQLAIMEERSRLARDLHDSVTQALYSINLFATASRRLAQSGEDPALLEDTLAELGDTAQQALKEMRLLLFRLRPSALQERNLVEALRQRLEAVEKRAGIEYELAVDLFEALPAPVEDALFAIAQESLNNSLKHAMATAVTVRLYSADAHITLAVSDNGLGFDPTAVAGTGGMGLISMRERAQDLGGTFTVTAAPEQGTTVIVRIPEVENQAADE